jgi:hypothetical protein
MIERFLNWLFSFFDNEIELCEKSLTTPDFDDMKTWTKKDIDLHAEAYGIYLDRRKTKESMIEDYKNEYNLLTKIIN